MKDSIKKTKLYYPLRNCYYKWLDIQFALDRLYRLAISNRKYTALKNAKNSYWGKRCFIIATGPSLQISDLDMIIGEYAFACNSIFGAYESTKWRPTFYAVQDSGVYEIVKDKIDVSQYKLVFFSSLISDVFSQESVIKYPLNLMGHSSALINNKIDNIHYAFSDKCDIEVFDGFSVTYSLFQIAIYMGFKEIFFLGQDCNYSPIGEKQHFMGDKVEQKINPHWKQTGKLICDAFESAKTYCDSNGIKVYNATRGGMFDVFPRVILEDIVNV